MAGSDCRGPAPRRGTRTAPRAARGTWPGPTTPRGGASVARRRAADSRTWGSVLPVCSPSSRSVLHYRPGPDDLIDVALELAIAACLARDYESVDLAEFGVHDRRLIDGHGLVVEVHFSHQVEAMEATRRVLRLIIDDARLAVLDGHVD